MASSTRTHTTTQGQMWDQVALDHLRTEMAMADVARANVNHADSLAFAGETRLAVPDAATVQPARTLPPWERM